MFNAFDHSPDFPLSASIMQQGLFNLYAEALPSECPPTVAQDSHIPEAYRLVANRLPALGDFASKAHRGEPNLTGANDCSWASCSLFKDVKPLRKLTRLRLEYPFIAKLSIVEGTGRHIANDRGHIDFWRYTGKCLSACVIAVEDPDQ